MSGATEKYDNLMKSKEEVTFAEAYESAISAQLEREEVPEYIQKTLMEKRLFGLKKYGENSFQSSLTNAFAAPILVHLRDELIDALNYIQHLKFIKVFGLYPQAEIEPIEDLQKGIIKAINTLEYWEKEE